MIFNISVIYEMGIGIKFNLASLCMMKTDVKNIKSCKAKGPRLRTPEKMDESISVLIRFIVCEVVPQRKSGSTSQNVYFFC